MYVRVEEDYNSLKICSKEVVFFDWHISFKAYWYAHKQNLQLYLLGILLLAS